MNEKYKRDHEFRRNMQHQEQESWAEASLTLAVMLLGAAAWVALILAMA